MSENLPYHDEQWDDLPLPDREEAWQKMKLLLEKEEDRRRLLPFWFWRYALSGLLLIGIATGSYFLLDMSEKEQAGIEPVKEQIYQEEREQQTPLQKEPQKKNGLSINLEKEKKEAKSKTIEVAKTEEKKKVLYKGMSFQRKEKRKGETSFDALPQSQRKQQSEDITVDIDRKEDELISGKISPVEMKREKDVLKKSSDSLKRIATKLNKDSISAKDSAAIITAPPVVSNKVKSKNRILFSAGVGLQQAIAFNGQQGSSYNLSGKQKGISDYVPSVYLRLQNESWFLQGEFHYNVPQPVKPVSFSQATSYNASNTMLQTEKLSIQKLYYHQLPVSVNYFVFPHWSVGAGGTYNLLAGAVTEEETESKNVTTGGETFSSRIVPVKGYKDSFLYKSAVGVLVQTDYHWRRISFGLRYTKNIQPFMKYTKPNGAVLHEKGQVLQAVLRFRLKG